ncbi:MAG: hypothetical protein C4536_03785 [Actinobacteria bacterium]|jgi:hypothetical protein|nr:MAG: hypothetical protein C4536_03785 [Actinomycetota bacterium]
MSIELCEEEKRMYLVIMAGGGYRVLYNLYRDGDEEVRERIVTAMGGYMRELEPVMDAYGLTRDPEGVATAMMLTEDLIGCEPAGKLLSVTPDEVVRKVTSCPWSYAFSDDGGTCRLVMAAMQEGIGNEYGLEISCEQTLAEGAEHCIWKVRKSSRGVQ